MNFIHYSKNPFLAFQLLSVGKLQYSTVFSVDVSVGYYAHLLPGLSELEGPPGVSLVPLELVLGVGGRDRRQRRAHGPRRVLRQPARVRSH